MGVHCNNSTPTRGTVTKVSVAFTDLTRMTSMNLQVYKYSAYIKRTRITHLKWIILDFIKMLYHAYDNYILNYSFA